MLNRVLSAFTRLVKRPAPTPAGHHFPTPAFTPRHHRSHRHPRVPKLVRLLRTSNGAWTGRYPK